MPLDIVEPKTTYTVKIQLENWSKKNMGTPAVSINADIMILRNTRTFIDGLRKICTPIEKEEDYDEQE